MTTSLRPSPDIWFLLGSVTRGRIVATARVTCHRQIPVIRPARALVGTHRTTPAECQSGIHQREVAERLRKVAEVAARDRVVLLRKQPDVVAQVEQPLEELARLVVPPLKLEHAHEPERAG